MTETESPKSESYLDLNKTGRSYDQYHKLGGIINQDSYQSAMDRADQQATSPEKTLVGQAKNIVMVSEIYLTKDEFSEVIALYAILRTDLDPEEQYHHGQMSDEQLMAEVPRMLNYPDQLRKIIKTYHHHPMF